MKRLDQILTTIARQHLGIETLVTRKSDSLDFHNVAVWSVKAALNAAYQAGAPTARQGDTGLPTRFDDYEIGPCLRLREDGDRDRFYYEPCEPRDADVWTLYGHIPGQGIEAIGDFETRELAEEVYARITGQPFTGACEADVPLRRMPADPELLEALRLAQRALNTAPRFRVGDTDSYKIAAIVDEAIEAATAGREP
jgi:hypothetical protein